MSIATSELSRVATSELTIATSELSRVVPERNVEIKARILSDKEFEKKIEIARNLTLTSGELIVQKDVFFNVPQSGRLKLRYLQKEKSQLIFYERPDVCGTRVSKYNKITVDEPEILEKILTASNGTRGALKKNRLLFLYEGCHRIHLDKVEDLGNFIEFEVCLNTQQTVENGKIIAEELMKIFCIEENNLMSVAYFDELEKLQN